MCNFVNVQTSNSNMIPSGSYASSCAFAMDVILYRNSNHFYLFIRTLSWSR